MVPISFSSITITSNYICLTVFFPGQSGSAGTRNVKHSRLYCCHRWWGDSGISWTICKSFVPRSRQITSPVSFYRPDALTATQQTASKHWRQHCQHYQPLNLLTTKSFGSRPSDHYFRSVCWFVCLFVCAEFFSAVFDPISIKLGHILYVWV